MYIILLYSYSVSKGFSILNSYFRLTLHTFRFLLRKCFERMTVSNRRSIIDQNPSISNDSRTAERERIEKEDRMRSVIRFSKSGNPFDELCIGRVTARVTDCKTME